MNEELETRGSHVSQQFCDEIDRAHSRRRVRNGCAALAGGAAFTLLGIELSTADFSTAWFEAFADKVAAGLNVINSQ